MREQILKNTSAYLLQNGIAGLSLRPLAKALGTSDRMLLYYFKDKDDLVIHAARFVAQGIFNHAHAEFAKRKPRSPGDFIETVWKFFLAPENRNVAFLFFEIDVLSLRESRLFGETAKYLMDEWLKLVKEGLLASGLSEKSAEKASIGVSAELHGLFLRALIKEEKGLSKTLITLMSRLDALRKRKTA